MIYTDFQQKKLPLLGFGAMRLPLIPGTNQIDQEHTEKMVDYAMAHGVNYFDTAYPYHGGLSEVVISRILKKYPRESYYLADKYPGHQLASAYDPADIFEDQLKKCGVEYFDFYLLHNVCELSMPAYTSPKWGIVDYFIEQKKLGKIKHLGFSSHGKPALLKDFLDTYGKDMEFCQIQLNYLDWTLQSAKEKVELLNSYNMPIWVMEPVRGGKLAVLDEKNTEKLHAMRPDESTAAWGFRFLQGIKGVTMVLSGMSNFEQMVDNVKTFEGEKPLSEEELKTLFDIAEGLKNAVPCTACRYCTDGCPMGLDIPMLISVYNDIKFAPTTINAMIIESLPEDKRPSACVGCGACTHACPQGLNIPEIMKDFVDALAKIPSWAAICKEREEAAKKNKK